MRNFFFHSFQIVEKFDAYHDPAEGEALIISRMGVVDSERNRLPLYTELVPSSA
jgi:hypothetical protein